MTSSKKPEVAYIAPEKAGSSIVMLLFIEPSTAPLKGFSSGGQLSIDQFRVANQFQLPDTGSSFTVKEGKGSHRKQGTHHLTLQNEQSTTENPVQQSSFQVGSQEYT